MPYKVVLKSWWAGKDGHPYSFKVPMSYGDDMLADPADEIFSMMDALIDGIMYKAEKEK